MRTASSWETEVTAWLMLLRSSALAISRSLWQEAQTHIKHTREAAGLSDFCSSVWLIRYREELAEVELSEEEALGLLQKLGWEATQLSLESVHGGFSSVHGQELFQHARVAHQVLQLRLSSSQRNLERTRIFFLLNPSIHLFLNAFINHVNNWSIKMWF